MPQVVLCPKCQAQNPPGQRICYKCGTRWCLSCGASVPSASRYCPRCGVYTGSEQQARATQRTAIASQPVQAPIPQQQPAAQYRPTTPQGMPQSRHSCPHCGGAIDMSQGQCLSCGILLSKNMLQKMQQQATPIPTTPSGALPAQAQPTPIPIPSQQPAPWQQHHGGFITGRQTVQPIQSTPMQNIPIPIVPEHATPMSGVAHQGIPVPRPVMQQSTPSYPNAGYTTPPVQPQLVYSPAYGSTHNMPRTSAPPQAGIPIPRAVASSMPAATAYAAQPMSFPSNAPHFSPMEQPLHISSRPAYAGKIAKSTSYSHVERGRHPAKSGLLLKTFTIVLLVIVGFVGAYYLIGEIGVPAASETISQSRTPSRPQAEPAVVSQPTENRSPETVNVAIVSVNETSAVIKWQTDKPTTSQIILRDVDGTRTQTEPGTALARDHRLTLSNLKAGTTYKYTVISKDAAGNEIRQDGELTTAKSLDTTPPMLSAVKILSITDSSVTVSWITDEAATSQIEYGKTDSYGTTTPLDKTLTTSHTIVISGLAPSTEYHFAVKSTDANRNEVISETDNVFRTTAPVPIGTQIGNRAPDFTLQDINGNRVSLQDFRGKRVIVNLWATWCGPCRAELPYFQDLYNTWSPDKLVILAIDIKESPENVKAVVTSDGFTFPVLLDTSGGTASAYALSQGSGIPRTFFIDEKGIIRKSQYGAFQTKQEIEFMLNSF